MIDAVVDVMDRHLMIVMHALELIEWHQKMHAIAKMDIMKMTLQHAKVRELNIFKFF